MRIILNASVYTVKRLRICLGTFVALEATAGSVCAAEAAAEAAFAAILEVERQMHPRAPNSDLARINSAAVHVPVAVHSSIRELLRLAGVLHRLTDGVFDPCLPTHAGRLTDLEIGTDEVVCRAPVALDLGGFAKGYAVDRAVESLIDSGCTAGLVNAGGDLRVFGPRLEPIFVRGPAGELTCVTLTDAALAVSDADSRGRPVEHRGYYLRGNTRGDPDPGRSLNSGSDPGLEGSPDLETPTPLRRRYAAVVAKRAVIADALTKCVLLCPQPGRALGEFGATELFTNREGTPVARI